MYCGVNGANPRDTITKQTLDAVTEQFQDQFKVYDSVIRKIAIRQAEDATFDSYEIKFLELINQIKDKVFALHD